MPRPARLRTALAAVIAGVLLAAGCSSSDEEPQASAERTTTEEPTEGPAPSLEFDDCTDVIAPQIEDRPGGDRDLSFGCGKMTVPLNYDDPNGDTLDMFVVRVRLADQAEHLGSLVVNPGGPGSSGLDAAVGLALSLPTNVLASFDLVGFDPRGVGLSEPVNCISDEKKDEITALDPMITGQEAIVASTDVSAELAEGCWDKYGERLEFFNTTATVRDMDRLREALGDEKLTYLGFSYGTLLGAVYAELFPENVRALVLDGAVDPAAGALDRVELQVQGFADAFNQFAADCAAQGDQCPIGPDPRGYVMALLDQARATPIPTSEDDDDRLATPGHVHLAVLSALYDREQWPTLAEALVEAKAGDAKGVFALDDLYNQRNDDGEHSNILDANITINCNDYGSPVTMDQAAVKMQEWSTKYPLFGPSMAAGLRSCQEWEPEQTPLPEVDGARDGEQAPPILVVGTVHDPATPYADAKDLSSQLTSAVLLTWEGESHTAYPKTSCVSTAVNDYLIDLTVPQEGTTCPLQ